MKTLLSMIAVSVLGAVFMMVIMPLAAPVFATNDECLKECLPVDKCNNLEENQTEVPEGYTLNDNGSCTKSVCNDKEALNFEETNEDQGVVADNKLCTYPEPVATSSAPVATPSVTPKLPELPNTGADVGLLVVLGIVVASGGAALYQARRFFKKG